MQESLSFARWTAHYAAKKMLTLCVALVHMQQDPVLMPLAGPSLGSCEKGSGNAFPSPCLHTMLGLDQGADHGQQEAGKRKVL